jgi:hypothetical protein
MPSKLPLKGESKNLTGGWKREKIAAHQLFVSEREAAEACGVKKLSEINCPFNGD